MAEKTPDNASSDELEFEVESLSSLKPRDTRKALAQSHVHTRTVGVLRWTLPLLVLFVLLALIVWPMLSTRQITTVVAENVPNLVVENLHLTGLDAKNQPYTLTAARALQAADVKNMIELEKPQGDILLESGAWLAGVAKFGRYDQANKNLWLNGDVHVFHDQGYQFSTTEAEVDLSRNAASGDKPVLIQGNFGEIEGSGFSITDKGNTVIVKGPAKARLQLQTSRPSGKTTATKPK